MQSVGSSAHGAGNPDDDGTTSSETSRPTSATEATAWRSRTLARAIGRPAMAMSAPSPSSQARTKVEK